jgi:hypothetical protein
VGCQAALQVRPPNRGRGPADASDCFWSPFVAFVLFVVRNIRQVLPSDCSGSVFTTKAAKSTKGRGASYHVSLDPVFQLRHVEVDQQTRADACQLHTPLIPSGPPSWSSCSSCSSWRTT